jgi:hypothetical protein
MANASIRKIVLGTLLAGLTAPISAARADEPEAVPPVDGPPSDAPQRAQVTVEQAPGVELPPQIASDLRAAIDDALAGRAQPGVPVDVTLEAGGVVVRVGTLWRRIAITRWDYPALRTVALHVLDLSQPAPEVPDAAPGSQSVRRRRSSPRGPPLCVQPSARPTLVCPGASTPASRERAAPRCPTPGWSR